MTHTQTHTDTPARIFTSLSTLHAVAELVITPTKEISAPGTPGFPDGLYATKLQVHDGAGRTVWEMTLFGMDDRAPIVTVRS